MQPLPAPVPRDQTVEGGAQLRISPSGFSKLTAIVPGMINSSLGAGFCTGRQDIGIGEVCHTNACAGGAQGCQIAVHIDSVNMSVPNSTTFRVSVQFDASTHVPVHVPIAFLPDINCGLDASLSNGRVESDLGLGIDATTGELTVRVTDIRTFDLSNIRLSGCAGVGDIVGEIFSAVLSFLASDIGAFVVDLLEPVIGGFIEGLLPSPLGMQGVLPLGDLIGMGAPDDADLETRAVAGGYVSLNGNGVSVGMITGFNADRNPATRALDVDSEPNLCVPARPAPALSLATTSRGTFALAPAGAFLGTPEAPSDLVIGLSETALDLAGHHAVSAGGLCLGVSSDLVPQLNLGTIGILVPSLSELGQTGREPLLLVLRPQQPLDFSIGDGTETSPHLTLHIRELAVDFYAFLFERYVRGFTVTLDMDVGLNMEFTTDASGQPAISPTLVGLDSSSIGVQVYNSELLREDPAQLEAVFPTLFDLVLPLIGSGLPEVALPDLGGFTLTNLSVGKVTTTEDDFLAIYGSLAPSMKTMRLVEASRPFSEAARAMKPAPLAAPVETSARVAQVTTPPPAEIRAFLEGRGGRLPEVALDLAGNDRELEWQWRLDGGLWRPFARDPQPVLRDRAFAVQGRHTLSVRARRQGDFASVDQTAEELELVIDSAGPRLSRDVEVDGALLTFTAWDLVTGDAALEWAFTSEASEEPPVFTRNPSITVSTAHALAAPTGSFLVHVRDERGNTTTGSFDGQIVAFHGRVASSGCGCSVGRAEGAGGAAALVLTAVGAIFFLGSRRRRRGGPIGLGLTGGWRASARGSWKLGAWVALFVVAAFSPACSCDDAAMGPSCETAGDCTCPDGTVPACSVDGMCSCEDEVAYGDIGMYSDLGVSPAATFVSAYNRTHGDLMVARVEQAGRIPDPAWEFVDGVPAGPVEIEGGTVRGGITAAGDDVGQHTSIAVTAAGDPRVSYYDVTGASLKFAARHGGAWATHVVDPGSAIADPELGGAEVGRYTSITVGSDDVPGIAYYATIYDAAGGRTEVRYARAKTASPASSADWDVFMVDTVALPPIPDGEDPPALPEGVGLFLSSARRLDGTPILAYYDRPNGDLKVATFDTAADTFRTPEVADGAGNEDVGWYPSVAVDASDVVHLSYVDAGHDNLLYCTLPCTPGVLDDGYRIDGQTSDGLDSPVFHLVGDDSAVVATGSVLGVAYQDATSHELRWSAYDPAGDVWTFETLAGDEDPFVGAYGFYAAAELDGEDVAVSTYVMNPAERDTWVEVFFVGVTVE